MKKTITILSAMCSFAALDAQIPSYGAILDYMRDAYSFCENDFYGSARSMGMGNAVTAVGGDLGGLGINPAAGVVAPYGQVELTPGVSISMASSQGMQTPSGESYLGGITRTNNTQFVFPNGAFSLNFDTGNLSGLTRFSFGFASNTSSLFNTAVRGSGANENTSSFAGHLASSATNNLSGWDKDGNPVWDDNLLAMAWKNDLIVTHDALPSGTFMGITEWPWSDGTVRTDNYLKQRYDYLTTGNKTDFLLNFGFDISDVVYFGANLGMQSLSYNLQETYREEAASSDFGTAFNNLSHGHAYKCNGFGIYGKFGIIVTPVAGLRLGAAIQTPTTMDITEGYSHTLSNSYGNVNLSDEDYVNNIVYKIKSPMRFNLGVAYALNGMAILSVDYERVNYRSTKFIARYASDVTWFNAVNEQIGGLNEGASLGASDIVRAGLEVKPIQEFAIRAGYNFISCGSRFIGEDGNPLLPQTHSASLGLGYDSPGSFFADLAVKMKFRPDMVQMPYTDYDNRADMDSPFFDMVYAPVLRSTCNLMTITATVGWRF